MNSASDLCILLIILAVIGAAITRRPWQGSGTSHGTARFATVANMQQAGMLSGNGLVLGQLRDGTLVRMNNVIHTATFAPTGAGKGVSLIVPWLRQCITGSCVITDPKGENYRLTAEWRRAMGHEVIRLDPFGVCGPDSDTFNLLSIIPDGPRCIDDAQVLAEAMVIRSAMEQQPYWNNQAANVMRGFLSFILSDVAGQDRNPLALREIVTSYELCMGIVAKMQEKGGVFARMAGVIEQLKSTEEGGRWSREGSSIMSVINEHTTFMDSPAIAKNLAKSSFDARKLLTGGQSVYIILPPHEMEAQSRWMRLVIASLVRLVMQEGAAQEVHIVIDEAGKILKGGMPAIEEGLLIGRSYNLRQHFFYQSLASAKETLQGKEAILLDNTSQIYFGVNDLGTAERVSKMLGSQTITVEDASASTSWQRSGGEVGGGGTASRSASRSWKEQGRELLKTDEVLNLHPDLILAFIRGVRPIMCWRVKWYEDWRFGGASEGRRFRLPVWWLLMAAAMGLVAWAMWNW